MTGSDLTYGGDTEDEGVQVLAPLPTTRGDGRLAFEIGLKWLALICRR